MPQHIFEIVLLARDFAFEERDTVANPLDIELQEAGLGEVTGSTQDGQSGDTLTITVEANDYRPALQLMRSLLRALEVPPSTCIRVSDPASGQPQILPVYE